MPIVGSAKTVLDDALALLKTNQTAILLAWAIYVAAAFILINALGGLAGLGGVIAQAVALMILQMLLVHGLCRQPSLSTVDALTKAGLPLWVVALGNAVILIVMSFSILQIAGGGTSLGWFWALIGTIVSFVLVVWFAACAEQWRAARSIDPGVAISRSVSVLRQHWLTLLIAALVVQALGFIGFLISGLFPSGTLRTLFVTAIINAPLQTLTCLIVLSAMNSRGSQAA